MIKPTELRLGNLVFMSAYVDENEFINTKDEMKDYNPKEWVIETITNIDNGTEYPIGTSCNYVSERIKPIPLTEEWLKRAFFKKKGKYFGKLITAFAILDLEITDKGIKCFISATARFSNQEMIVFRKIKYIHELQNLYFAITDEELVFSEA